MSPSQIKPKQLSSMGETPAEARAHMKSSGGAATGVMEAFAAEAEFSQAPARHLATMRELEGFTAPPAAEDATSEDAVETTEPPTPTKAMDMIRQLSQDKLQMQTELDAAFTLIARYVATFGELD